MKTLLILSTVLLLNTLNYDKASLYEDIQVVELHEDCEDITFGFVEMYYDNGGTDNFEAGQVFYSTMWLCETKPRQ